MFSLRDERPADRLVAAEVDLVRDEVALGQPIASSATSVERDA